MIYLLGFVLAIVILVGVHEFGHYWAARRSGVVVERFSIGFGTVLFKKQDKNQCEWTVSAIPLGGYVRIKEEGEQSYALASAWQKAFITIAGPMANFVLAVLLFAAISWLGISVPIKPAEDVATDAAQPALIAGVQPASAAERAGLKEGDVLVRVDGQTITNSQMLIDYVRQRPESSIALEVIRQAVLQQNQESDTSDHADDGRAFDVQALPSERVVLTLGKSSEAAADQPAIGKLGAMLAPYVASKKQHLGPLEGLWFGVERTATMSWLTLSGIGKMLVGAMGLDNLSGPVGIAQMAGRTMDMGFQAYLGFLAILSISLGVFNLLPLPLLDGGRLVGLAAEAVLRRELSTNAKLLGQRIGLFLLVGLTVLAVGNDVLRLLF